MRRSRGWAGVMFAITAALVLSCPWRRDSRDAGNVVQAKGIETAQTASAQVTPYRIQVPDAVLTDLKERLARTRFPSEIEGSGWDYGTNLAYLKELVAYWRTTFNWREQERKLNQLPQFKTTIDDVEIHFVHQRSSNPNATPLVMIHGWPGSIFEFTKVIGPLTEPSRFGGNANDAFHVVALSLPGYGFSGQPRTRGYSNRRIASIIAQLMARLGYTRYGAQGGDWGGIIVRQLGLTDPQHLIGLHSNLCIAGAPPGPNPNAGVPADEMKRVEAVRTRVATETGYSQIQGTKPMTLGYGLNDSPAALAAWIVEKFRTWSDSGGQVEKKFSKDELLTNITIYWVTETGPSSVRLYYENRIDAGLTGHVDVPFACARFPGELFGVVPRQWIEAQYNVAQFTEMPRGGHFAALEEPQLLVEDVRKFFRGRR
jgi:pimeloyl-ACP methyl ester carboxylesterase